MARSDKRVGKLEKDLATVKCKICRGVYPDDSDYVNYVYRLEKNGRITGIGFFCDDCIPKSAEIINNSFTVREK